MAVELTFYDGIDCIGGNKILLEDRGTTLFLDFGTSFKAEGNFFNEFLGPRSIFGLTDLLSLKLLPPLRGAYRSDLECPGIWQKHQEHPFYRKLKVDGVLLSHAHFDHCGYISYLADDIPIISTLTTALICKSLQDTAGSNRIQEICYTIPREFKDGMLKTMSYRKAPYEQRPFQVFAASNQKLASFWETCPGSRGLNPKPLQFLNSEFKIGNILIRCRPVDHSIPGAAAFGLKTNAGWVIYTGDFRLHGWQSHLTKSFIRQAAALRPRVLICEGTHPATKTPVSEEEVCTNSLDVVKKTSGLVVADFGPRNIERLLSFLKIARETDRVIALTPKDIYILEALYLAGEPGVPDPFREELIALYMKPKGTLTSWEKMLLERFQSSSRERLLDAAKVNRNQGDYILAFSYYDFPALLDIAPDRGGAYIYSSSEAFDEEMLIDHERIYNWIEYFGLKLYGSLGKNREKSGFHASGHVHGPGLQEAIETIAPEILIPVHTESREFFEQFSGLCQVVFPEKGVPLKI